MPGSLSPGTEYSLTVKVNPTKMANLNSINDDLGENDAKPVGAFNKIYHLINKPSVNYKHTELPSLEEIESIIKTAKTISNTNSVTAGTSTTLSILSVILSADSAGVTIKFSQVSKLISRLRMLDVNFGKIFGNFLNALGSSFDSDLCTTEENDGKDYQRKIDFIEQIGSGNKGRFDDFGVDLFLVG